MHTRDYKKEKIEEEFDLELKEDTIRVQNNSTQLAKIYFKRETDQFVIYENHKFHSKVWSLIDTKDWTDEKNSLIRVEIVLESKIFSRLCDMKEGTITELPTNNLLVKEIYFINVNFLGNAGDYWSSPLKYYVFPSGYRYQQIHFLDFHHALTTQDQHQNLLIKDKLIVLGGGGLITTPGNFVNNITRYLIENNRVITWGIGSNTVEKIDWAVLQNKNLILATTRDINWEIDIEYLPCVSCKHKSFDKKHTQPTGLGIIEHPSYPIPIPGDKILNTEDVEKIIDFISSKEQIITSTYHGFYWSQLLEKKVAIYTEPGKKISSKFGYAKHRPVLCNSYNYMERLENSTVPIGLLQESRKLNDDFYQRVVQEILKCK